MTLSWTQPICEQDWRARNPGREPVRLREKFREDETCCICGNVTRSGIYTRIDPNTVTYPKEKEQ